MHLSAIRPRHLSPRRSGARERNGHPISGEGKNPRGHPPLTPGASGKEQGHPIPPGATHTSHPLTWEPDREQGKPPPTHLEGEEKTHCPPGVRLCRAGSCHCFRPRPQPHCSLLLPEDRAAAPGGEDKGASHRRRRRRPLGDEGTGRLSPAPIARLLSYGARASLTSPAPHRSQHPPQPPCLL